MSIYVVRHGQTDWNLLGYYQGRTDIPLNSTGIKQAKQLNSLISKVRFDRIICSPLKRAIDTAKICFSNMDIKIEQNDALIERCFGDIEGTNGKQFSDLNNDILLDFELNYSDHNIEPIQSLFKRVYLFLDDLLKNYSNENILLVTHNAVSIAIECYFNNISKNSKLIDLALDNCKCRIYEKGADIYEKI